MPFCLPTAHCTASVIN